MPCNAWHAAACVVAWHPMAGHIDRQVHASIHVVLPHANVVPCVHFAMQTENIRIAYIPEVAPGTSSVTLRLIVPSEQYDLGPLTLKGFKATGFPGKMLPGQGSGRITDDAEVCAITGDCTDLEAESAIR